MNESNKYFYYRNKKISKNKIYIEILFGDKNIGERINIKFKHLSKKNIPFKKYLFLSSSFKKLKIDHLI